MTRRSLLVLLLVMVGLPLAAEESPSLDAIAPFLDAQTFAVARVELAKLDPGAAVELMARLAPNAPPKDELKAASQKAQSFLSLLREYGAQDLYVIASFADIPERPPVILLTLKPGGNEALVTSHVQQLKLPWLPAPERIQNSLVFSPAATVQRLKANTAAPRPDLATALAAAGDAPIRLAAALPPDVQRVVKELVGKLPPEIGGGEGQDLVDALRWTSVALEPPPKLSLKWLIQSKDETSAAALRPRILAGLNLLVRGKLQEEIPGFTDLVIRVTPQVKGNRLELSLAGEEAEQLVAKIAKGPFHFASEAASRNQSINNLKQMALAMHNYHDVHRTFPAAANFDKAGKPLLSWRVHILPYIDQEALYREFHLDEPWDSEHNKRLIPRMPKTYLDPATPELAKEGKTIYVVPVGEKTVFGEKKGTEIFKIPDGTSNTLMIVDVPADKAVVWTKPEDLPFDPKDPARGLTDGGRKQFITAFCDGSVRVISASIDPADVRRLLQRDDGEVIKLP